MQKLFNRILAINKIKYTVEKMKTKNVKYEK